MPAKPGKYRFKIELLVDAYNRYVLNAVPYMGKAPKEVRPANYKANLETVRKLTQHVRMTGCNITGDRGYTQVELVQELLENELTYIGTLNRARAKKHLLPEMLKGHPRPHKDSKFVFTYDMSESYGQEGKATCNNPFIPTS